MVLEEPECTNVTFWYIPPSLRGRENEPEYNQRLHKVNIKFIMLYILCIHNICIQIQYQCSSQKCRPTSSLESNFMTNFLVYQVAGWSYEGIDS